MNEDTDEAAPGPKRASLLRNLLDMLASQAVTFALSTITFIAIPRFIDPAGVGVIRLSMSLWAIAGVFGGLGAHRFLALQFAKDPIRASRLVLPVLGLRTTATLICAIPLAIFTVRYDGPDVFVALMVLQGVSTLLYQTSAIFQNSLIGLEQMRAPAIASAASSGLGATGTVIVLLLGGREVAIIAVAAAAAGVSLSIISIAYYRQRPIAPSAPRDRNSYILKGSVAFLFTQAAMIVYQQVDSIVIAALVDQDTLGWYSQADRLFGSLLFLAGILAGAVFPVAARLHDDDPDHFQHLIRQIFGVVLLAAVPIGLGATLVAQEFMPLLAGEPFRPAGDVLMAFGPAITVLYLTSLIGTVALAIGRERFWNFLLVGAIVSTVILDVILVPWADGRFGNGAIGGAIAYTLTESGMLVAGLIVVVPFLNTPQTWKRSGKIIVAGVVMLAVSWPLRNMLFVIPGIVGAIVYIGVITALRTFSAADRAELAAVFRERGNTAS